MTQNKSLREVREFNRNLNAKWKKKKLKINLKSMTMLDSLMISKKAFWETFYLKVQTLTKDNMQTTW